MNKTKVVTCKSGCTGETKPCLDEIKQITDDGDIAFMLYTHHIVDDLVKEGYTISVGEQNGIPIAMQIFKEHKNKKRHLEIVK